MGMDTDYIFSEITLDEILNIVKEQPHGKRQKIAEDIEKFFKKIKRKYVTKIKKSIK